MLRFDEGQTKRGCLCRVVLMESKIVGLWEWAMFPQHRLRWLVAVVGSRTKNTAEADGYTCEGGRVTRRDMTVRDGARNPVQGTDEPFSGGGDAARTGRRAQWDARGWPGADAGLGPHPAGGTIPPGSGSGALAGSAGCGRNGARANRRARAFRCARTAMRGVGKVAAREDAARERRRRARRRRRNALTRDPRGCAPSWVATLLVRTADPPGRR